MRVARGRLWINGGTLRCGHSEEDLLAAGPVVLQELSRYRARCDIIVSSVERASHGFGLRAEIRGCARHSDADAGTARPPRVA